VANVFIIKDESLITPALGEGCINGVMRRKILELKSQISDLGLHVSESVLAIEDILNAEEIFLTNSMNGIRWVRQFGDAIKTNLKTLEIYKRLIQPIFIEKDFQMKGQV
ncbi:MAG: aminotransferase class IV, partial [Bacteroidia bacterium]|nr:aminotransferase class IV [Bacteroidia bacterium]